MTRRALLLHYRSSSSKSNIAHSGKAGNVWSKHICGKWGFVPRRAPDLFVRIWQGAGITKLRYQGLSLYERHVCYYSGCGDFLLDRFWSMMEFEEYHDQRTVDKASGSLRISREGKESHGMYHNNPGFGELCESFPAVTKLMVHRRLQVGFLQFWKSWIDTN